jgi:Bacterial flagellin N-terminal helical region.
MNIQAGAAVNGGAYSRAQAREKSTALEKLSSGFRIDSSGSTSDTAPPDTRVRTANLENAIKNASDSIGARNQADNAMAEMNANFVRQRSQGMNHPPATKENGQLDGYA